MSQHLYTLQINDTLQTLLGIFGLLPTAAVSADADEAAAQDQCSNHCDSNH